MTSRRQIIALAGAAFLAACSPAPPGPGTETLAHLPEAVSNNAVAAAIVDGRMMAYSFAGLRAGKTWQDLTADAYACDLEAGDCREIGGLPDGTGRLAAVAATAGNQIYVFGGYTVAEDGSERSTPEVWQFDPQREAYARRADIPVPVDDSVALVYADRYIYLVSGWHDNGNTDAVQVYDTAEDRWFAATSWPGAPVFGHAGALIDNRLLICGGVEVVPAATEGARRTFELYEACWSGEIDLVDPARISWSHADLPGAARYRAAMTGSAETGRYVILGGAINPYNYNGIGYDGAASEPIGMVMQIGESAIGRQASPGGLATMDHRGLIGWNGGFVTLGGMTGGQAVTGEVRITYPD
ncbi:MAG: galactose oxidase [Alphaproteobacteria bacterium]|nr:galactose oxidase [Alphaproteobacteria bacterium]